MSGFENFDELTELVADYAHRPELLERVQNVFVPFASIRIGRDLKARANETSADLSGAAGNPIELPENFGSIRSVWYNGNRGPHSLVSRDDNTINSYPIQGGSRPRAYMIRNKELHVRPFVAGSFSINYFRIPELTASAPVNDVLEQFPMLYLYAALVELHVWTLDAEQRSIALATYGDEVKLINRNEGRARASAASGVGGV